MIAILFIILIIVIVFIDHLIVFGFRIAEMISIKVPYKAYILIGAAIYGTITTTIILKLIAMLSFRI